MARRSHGSSAHARLFRACASLVALALAGGCSQLVFLKPPSVPRKKGSSETERGPAFAQVPRATSGGDIDWPMYNRGYDGTRFSPLAQITTANVSTLAPACTFPLGV